MDFIRNLFKKKQSAITPNSSQSPGYEKDEKIRYQKEGKNICLAFYLFNSNIISNNGNVDYGGYAEKNLLKSLFVVLKPEGGWNQYDILTACHGDISDIEFAPTIRVLENWIRNRKYGINITNLDRSLKNMILSGNKLDYWPYAVGIGPIQERHALGAHNELKTGNIDGYLGVFTLGNVLLLSQVANELMLPSGIEIKGTKCKGFLLSKAALHDAGLENYVLAHMDFKEEITQELIPENQGSRAIFSCPECGSSVSVDAIRCSKCGHKFIGSPVSPDKSRDKIQAKVARKSDGTELPPPLPRGDANFHRSIELAQKAQWREAFLEMREAVNQGNSSAKQVIYNQVWCQHCKKIIKVPDYSATVDYSRFWHGKCPQCENLLIFKF